VTAFGNDLPGANVNRKNQSARRCFGWRNRLGGSVIAMKALFIIADLALAVLLFWALSKLESPFWWAILYAWHPLAIIEIAGSGHVDGIGALFLFAAVALVIRHSAISCVAW
jgi:hypothetical protein